ncbi:hypothetical protein HU200_053601 [Digitaria exilis]|uniref:Uncharacterized protein n=1 Tax=Digitaria exilis TaxID=1010633 RepID=A0A835ARX1_9POAL|nr:hypothetical protein HU200_053601 [Digitaria exilis]
MALEARPITWVFQEVIQPQGRFWCGADTEVDEDLGDAEGNAQIKLYLLYRYKPANLMHDDKPNHRMPRGDGRGTNVKDGRVLCLRLDSLAFIYLAGGVEAVRTAGGMTAIGRGSGGAAGLGGDERQGRNYEVGVVDNIQIATKEAEGMDTQAMVIKVETLVVLELGLTSLTVTVAQRKI